MKQKQPQRKQVQEQEQTKSEWPTQERLFKTAIANRWKIKFKLFEGEELIGTPQAYDPYTVTVITEDNRLIVVFKHTIRYFEPLLP